MNKEARSPQKGLVIVYTGDGKGKTTAALGLAFRACGHGLKVLMIQFIKGSWHYGELNSAERLAPCFTIIQGGKGYVRILGDKLPIKEHKAAARAALEQARQALRSGEYHILILDEVNNAIEEGLLSPEEVLELVREKPERLHLVLTGRAADQSLIDAADLVTEMREVKHPFQKGLPAVLGIDF